MLNKLIKELQNLKNSKKAKILSRFFKTGRGEYGEGDIFLGIVVPDQRKIAKKYTDLSLNEIEELLSSKIHEYRLTALFILIEKYNKANDLNKQKIFDFYLSNINYVNNWDLIDLSAEKILGNYLINKDKSILYKFSKSNSFWERRIAILSTFQFIKNNKYEDTLKISEILVNDKHDLIQKAVGWMLREIGKRNLNVEEEFLMKYYKKMPRTMLRYSIERFSDEKKRFYMKK